MISDKDNFTSVGDDHISDSVKLLEHPFRRYDELERLAETWRTIVGGELDALNLVPSENRMSPLASLPLSTDLYNRYFFNDGLDPKFWQFRGGQAASNFEVDVALPALRRLTASEHVNVRPISGMNAMLIAISALAGRTGSTVASIAHSSGGHYATTSLAERLGMRAATIQVQKGAVDLPHLRKLLAAEHQGLLYLDLQNSLYPLDVAPVVQLVRECSPDTLVHVDVSHVLGLVLGGVIPNPLDLGADSAGGSTHKTFPGPHKGILWTRRADIASRFRRAQFDLLSSHHFAETLSLGLAAYEFEAFGASYAPQILRNASWFAHALSDHGFDVIGEADCRTRTHQVWVRIGDAEQTDRLAQALYTAGVRVNVQTDLPGHSGPMFRLGVSEVTFDGADEAAMAVLAEVFRLASIDQVDRARDLRKQLRAKFSRPYHYTWSELQQINFTE